MGKVKKQPILLLLKGINLELTLRELLMLIMVLEVTGVPIFGYITPMLLGL